jgi:GNAT superfamily N-acetyltransferase
MSIVITTLTDADVEAAANILDSAFGPSDSYVGTVQRFLALQPDGCLIARFDGVPAGTVGAINYGDFAYIGLMAVDQAMQRRGIARKLMDDLLAWIDASGCPISLLDATEVGALLYPLVGFEDDGHVTMYECKTLNTQHTEFDRAIEPLRMDNLAALVAFDTPLFGADRSRVFASYLADFPDRAFMMCDASGQITGYVIAQPQRIGPWMACTPQVAEALLTKALSLPYAISARVIIPAENTSGIAMLERHGFVQTRVLRHMRRGGTQQPRNRSVLYGQTTFALG